jgi:hypothetical protein
MRALEHRKRASILAMAVAAGSIAMAPGSEGFACGYDDPQSVSRGFLNWIYPDSLHVIGAISREVAIRRLPLANFNSGGVDLFGRKFKLAKTSLDQFGAMLGAASHEPLRTPVAVVLVEPMLWARFEPTADGFRTTVHVAGAERGDLVMVTGEAVVAEIGARHLTFGEAYARGMVRLYGGDAQVAAFVQTYRQLGAGQSALDMPGEQTAAPDGAAVDASLSPFAVRQSGTTSTSEMFQKLAR